MSIRTDFLGAKLARFLERFTAPRDLSERARDDATAALLRAVDRAAPRSDYDGWWPRFEDELEAAMRTRAWPTVNEIDKAAKAIPGPKAAKISGADLTEMCRREQLRHWWKGEPWQPGGPMPSIAPFVVTWERCLAIGMSPAEAERAVAYAADPYNEGTDPTITERERRDHAERMTRTEWQAQP